MQRTFVGWIELVPNGERLGIVLRGDLAAILTFAAGAKNLAFLEEKAVTWVCPYRLRFQAEPERGKRCFGCNFG